MNGLKQINSLLLLEKRNTPFFINQVKKDDLPLVLPRLLIKNDKIERVKSKKFLGVLLDEKLSRKDHIKYIENKVAKNISLLYRVKLILDQTCYLHYSFRTFTLT